MSELPDLLVEVKEQNEVSEDECFDEEQTKQIEELQAKLLALREENKRQLDKITKDLDELLITKNIIAETLDPSEDKYELPIEHKNLKVADLIAKIVGLGEETESIDSSSENQLEDQQNEESSDVEKDLIKSEQSQDENISKDNINNVGQTNETQSEVMETENSEKINNDKEDGSVKVKKESNE